ncbi:MAG: PVC-type heme-binding CxxCH protein [Planctomycetota bacterium]
MSLKSTVAYLVLGISCLLIRPLNADDKVEAKSDSSRTIQKAVDAPQPLSPEESAKRMRLPAGFRIELIASEPLVEEPSCIAFDEKGRLFVCELHGYNVEGEIDVRELNKTGKLDREVRRLRWELMGGKIADEARLRQYGKLKLLFDDNDDGRMDRAEVWADDLPACYGVVAARGGVIVTCAPDIVYMADQDGDGKPDVREVLFTGFRKEVLERGINNPRWGLDNWIYIGSGGSGGKVTGPNLREPFDFGRGDFRIRADGSAIEHVNGSVGTFGMTINDVGDRFPASGGQPAIYALPLPYRYLARNPHVGTPSTNHHAVNYNRGFRISAPHPWRVKRREDPEWIKFYGERETNSSYFSGGCSNEHYGDKLFPVEFRDNLFYCEPSLNIVHRVVMSRDGAGYRGGRADSEQKSEFLASTDQWFRPMNLRVGPHGGLYIVDMYREIIEDYSAIPRFLQQQYGLEKGRSHGRIWRLVPASADSLAGQIDLAALEDSQLVEQIRDESSWVRRTAQRLLVERGGSEIRTQLASLLAPNERNSGPSAIHALYALDGLAKISVDDVLAAMSHADYRVRIHGLRLASRWIQSGDILKRAITLTADPDPSVRLQAALTLGDSSSPEAAEAMAELANRAGGERWMQAAILSSAIPHTEQMLDRLLDESGEAARDYLAPLAKTQGGIRDAKSISRTLARASRSDESRLYRYLKGLCDGLESSEATLESPTEGWIAVALLLEHDSPKIREQAGRLATRMPPADASRIEKLLEQAYTIALDADQPAAKRLSAISAIAGGSWSSAQKVADELLARTEPIPIQIAIIETMDSFTDPEVSTCLVEHWDRLTPQVRNAAMRVIASRANRLRPLLKGLQENTIRPIEIPAYLQERMMKSPDDGLASSSITFFQNAANNNQGPRLADYVAAFRHKPDLIQGQKVFVENCSKCHKVAGVGKDVGPNLGTILNKPNEAILGDILNPSSRIEPEHRSYVIETSDGRTHVGLLTSESATSIRLVDQQSETHELLRKTVVKMVASEVSLMPDNLAQIISPIQMRSLIAYLREELAEK